MIDGVLCFYYRMTPKMWKAVSAQAKHCISHHVVAVLGHLPCLLCLHHSPAATTVARRKVTDRHAFGKWGLNSGMSRVGFLGS